MIPELFQESLDFPPITKALTQAKCLVGGRAGIVRRVYLDELIPDDPRAFLTQADPADIQPFNIVPASNYGAGCDLNRDRAIMRAIGECVERYCGAMYDPQELEWASYVDWQKEKTHAVDPTRIVLFSEQQYSQPDFPFRKAREDSSLAWVNGYSLSRRCPAKLPAAFVYVPYAFDTNHDPPTHIPISTGLAAGPNRACATLKGITEILERDAFMIAWRNRLPLSRVDPNKIGGELAEIVDRCSTTGGVWQVFTLPSDIGIPIFMSLLVNPTGLPKTSFGAAAALVPEMAVASAMRESMLTRFYINRLSTQDSTFRCDSDYKNVRTLLDHAKAHAVSTELYRALSRLNGPFAELPKPFCDDNKQDENQLAAVVDHLSEQGFEVFAVDLTTRDVAEAGFSVVRVIIPGMQPLDNDHVYPHQGGERLYTLPVRLGLRETPLEEDALNPLPHPFP